VVLRGQAEHHKIPFPDEEEVEEKRLDAPLGNT